MDINGTQVRLMDVTTPLGQVHLAGFEMMVLEDGASRKINHREIIFQILSRVAGVPVTANDLQESKEQPRPEFPKLDFDVNWTHSGGYCIVAYGEPGVQLGVDLEKYSPKHLKLADRFYSAEEAAYLRGLASQGDCDGPDESAMREFYRLWCRKEALYKCVGGSFFEGAVGRSVLESPLMAGPAGEAREVHFVDLDGKELRVWPQLFVLLFLGSTKFFSYKIQCLPIAVLWQESLEISSGDVRLLR